MKSVLDPLPSPSKVQPSLRLRVFLLPSSFCSLPLQSLPSAQPQLQKIRMKRISPRSPRATKKFPHTLPPPNLMSLVQHPDQFIFFPRWSTRELTQGNLSPWLCPQPNRLELVPPPSPEASQEVAPSENSVQCLFLLPWKSVCQPAPSSAAEPGRDSVGEVWVPELDLPELQHQTCQPCGSHQQSPSVTTTS